MKVFGNFNKVSKKLRDELIAPIRPGQVVKFQLLNGQYDVSTGRTVFGSSVGFTLKETIFDPYAREDKGKFEGDFVEIGVPDKVKGNIVETCKKHYVESMVVGVPGNGTFYFTGGNVDDMQVYEFFCLSSLNESNPHRDNSKEARFVKVDGDSVDEALTLVDEMGKSEILKIAAGLNINKSLPYETVRVKVKDYAKLNTKVFLEKFKTEVTA